MRWTSGWLALTIVASLLSGCGKSRPVANLPVGERPPPATAPEPAAFFRDVTATSGVQHTYHNGEEASHYAILESLGGGVGLLDYDGDGLLDLFVTGGGAFAGADKKEIRGLPCRLYRNLGNWKFNDVTTAVGLDGIAFYNHGCAAADYDRDGWCDLLVTGYGRLALYHNVPDGHGGRRFEDVTRAAGLLRDHFWSSSAAWGDLDGDGFADLYVCQYVDWSFTNHPTCEGYTPAIPRDICPPRQFDARPHAVYRNQRDGTFRDVSKEAGLHTIRAPGDYDQLTHFDAAARDRLREADREREFGKGLGVLLVDVNGDTRPDIYIANDTTDKFLYMNLSKEGQLRLQDQALLLGAARDDQGAPNGSMGVDAADLDGSGRPSLLVTNYENELHALYRNVPGVDGPLFQYSSKASGLGSLGRQYVGFGTGFLDLDRDGWEDLVIVNGHVIRHPTRTAVQQLPVLLRNQGSSAEKKGIQFTNVTSQGGSYFLTPHRGRGLAVGDLDNDGRPDLVISHLNAPVALLRGVGGAEQHWLGIELNGKDHADVTGARLILDVGKRRLTRFARGGGSYLSSGDRRHLFGLGSAERIDKLTVIWPGGQEQSWDGLAIDRYWRLTAGQKEPQPR